MPEIDRLTFEIEKYADRTDISDRDKVTGLKTLEDVIRDATAKVVGVFVDCTSDAVPSESPTQLPTLPGFILRDEPTEEAKGPGVWMPLLIRNDDAIGLVIPGVGVVATIMPNGLYSIGPSRQGSTATVQKAKDVVEQGFVVCGNKYDYHHETTHHITTEVVDDVAFKNYTCFHLHHLTNRDDFFDTCTWTTRTLAESRYDSYVAGKIPCSLCGILPGGVPVLLKSYDPNAEETKP